MANRRVYKVQINIQLPLDLAEYIDNLPFRTRSEALEAIVREYRVAHTPKPIERLWDDEGTTSKAK